MTKNDGRLSEITHTRRNPRTSFFYNLQQLSIPRNGWINGNLQLPNVTDTKTGIQNQTSIKKQTGMKGLLSLPDWSPIIQVYFIHSPAKSSCFLLLRFFLLQKFKRFSGGRFLKHRLNPPFIRSVYLSNLQIGKNLHVLKGRTSKE